MYSLYRAWLSLGPNGLPNILPSLPSDIPNTSTFSSALQLTNGAPDVNLQVGPSLTHFSAHRNILSAHSGFFKAIFLTHTGTNPISVPNINVDEFSSLLTFMYTGFLDLNYTNIYNILLSTHILHMPSALEICRSFLMQNNPLEGRPSTSTVIKPIPSKQPLLPHQQQPISAPLFGNLQKSDSTPFRSIGARETQSSSKHSTNTVDHQEHLKTVVVEKNKSKKREDIEKTVVDVACCDGPVRFHRVLNRNYGLKEIKGDVHIEHIDRNVLLNKIMTENIRDKQSENEDTGGSDMFTCVYCNHTFKSQYCYQKHARRHLNPVNLEVKSIQKVENFVSSKREVKLLDMNVQYYPCKTCGSKFPSYYFVHKHRKMCHADEVGEGSVKSVEIGEKSNSDNVNLVNESKNNEESEIEVGND